MVNFLVPDVKVMPSEVVLPNFQRPRESGIQNVTGDETSDSSCDELLFVTEHAVRPCLQRPTLLLCFPFPF